MLSTSNYKYYQPENKTTGDLPDGLFSFMAFPLKEDCHRWLEANGLNPDDFEFKEYSNNDIEGVMLLDGDGEEFPRIESLSDEDIEDMLTDEVMLSAGSIDNLIRVKQDEETEDEFNDRLYGEALDLINDAICGVEDCADYNFQSYCGTPETEWYDEARDEAVKRVMRWMLGEEC